MGEIEILDACLKSAGMTEKPIIKIKGESLSRLSLKPQIGEYSPSYQLSFTHLLNNFILIDLFIIYDLEVGILHFLTALIATLLLLSFRTSSRLTTACGWTLLLSTGARRLLTFR